MRYCGSIQGPKCTVFMDTPTKTVHLAMEIRGMYKPKDRKTQVLFPELFPFGGSLDPRNRWLRVCDLIPWEELEYEYLKYFSDVGRPAKDAQLILGLLLLKHMTKLSDRELIAEVMENPYMQAFCGFHSLATARTIDASTLTQARKRLGPKFFRDLEKKTYAVLIERGIIRARGLLADATVFPEEIKFPTDKPARADGTAWAAVWESRSLPGFFFLRIKARGARAPSSVGHTPLLLFGRSGAGSVHGPRGNHGIRIRGSASRARAIF